MNVIELAELGFVPDVLIRIGIRRLLAKRRSCVLAASDDQRTRDTREFVNRLRDSPLAVATDAANKQHYEVPHEFFEWVLGPRLKYSCCHFETAESSLAGAEEEMLRQTCERAEIQNGNRILELGCGWGSLTLWMAEQFRDSQVVAVSNSVSQREFIQGRARAKGLGNVRVITADMREFDCDEQFDRVVSVEMFEHMRNYELLLRRVSNWLTPDGKAFVHVFCHRDSPYLFESAGAANWMGRHFFTGGMMPSEGLFRHFDKDLKIEQQWRVEGLHYERTCEAWLQNLDRNREAILHRFEQDLTPKQARRSLQRWRIFFMACAELFGYDGGNEWFVGHYRFTKTPAFTDEDSQRENGIEITVRS
jgi:cyclopropane-fatty-acyl-phospholipid synthase